ncbi:hypothetical protein QR680_000452 [Steinernema hermaphroditum]|uniref:BRCT domain-containing protein n=1 Tax=Steinernema hermaphroditum TaxID=289476 RepID=A0AA39GUM8_9BILA|nr:hypothetical protein QR680_000452 [Steinernema hermaphroditum]
MASDEDVDIVGDTWTFDDDCLHPEYQQRRAAMSEEANNDADDIIMLETVQKSGQDPAIYKPSVMYRRLVEFQCPSNHFFLTVTRCSAAIYKPSVMYLPLLEIQCPDKHLFLMVTHCSAEMCKPNVVYLPLQEIQCPDKHLFLMVTRCSMEIYKPNVMYLCLMENQCLANHSFLMVTRSFTPTYKPKVRYLPLIESRHPVTRSFLMTSGCSAVIDKPNVMYVPLLEIQCLTNHSFLTASRCSAAIHNPNVMYLPLLEIQCLTHHSFLTANRWSAGTHNPNVMYRHLPFLQANLQTACRVPEPVASAPVESDDDDIIIIEQDQKGSDVKEPLAEDNDVQQENVTDLDQGQKSRPRRAKAPYRFSPSPQKRPRKMATCKRHAEEENVEENVGSKRNQTEDLSVDASAENARPAKRGRKAFKNVKNTASSAGGAATCYRKSKDADLQESVKAEKDATDPYEFDDSSNSGSHTELSDHDVVAEQPNGDAKLDTDPPLPSINVPKKRKTDQKGKDMVATSSRRRQSGAANSSWNQHDASWTLSRSKSSNVEPPILTAQQQVEVDFPDDMECVPIGARVYGLWDKVYYPAIVVGYDKAKYRVYFVEDKKYKTLTNVGIIPIRDVRPNTQVDVESDDQSATVEIKSTPIREIANHWNEGFYTGYIDDAKEKVITFSWEKISFDTEQAKTIKAQQNSFAKFTSGKLGITTKQPTSRRGATTAEAPLIGAESPVIALSSPVSSTQSCLKQKFEEIRQCRAALNSEDANKLFVGKQFVLTSAIAPSVKERSFIKKWMETMIVEEGGVVLKDLTDADLDAELYLISETANRTAKYINALAFSVPCVKYSWLVSCFEKHEFLDYEPHMLPAGIDIITDEDVAWHPNADLLKGRSVCLCGDSGLSPSARLKRFVEMWTPMLEAMGAKVLTELPEVDDDVDFVLTDGIRCRDMIVQANERGVPVMSSAWIIASMIAGYYLPLDAHESFLFGEDENANPN